MLVTVTVLPYMACGESGVETDGIRIKSDGSVTVY